MHTVPHDLEVAYMNSVRTKRIALNTLWDNAIRNNWSAGTVQRLRDLSFQIKCSSGIYGYPHLSEAAGHMYMTLAEPDLSNTNLKTLNAAKLDFEKQLALATRNNSIEVKSPPHERLDADCNPVRSRSHLTLLPGGL